MAVFARDRSNHDRSRAGPDGPTIFVRLGMMRSLHRDHRKRCRNPAGTAPKHIAGWSSASCSQYAPAWSQGLLWL